MLLGGMWHGANWTFIMWGGLHGLYLVINHLWRNFGLRDLPSFISIGLTFVAVSLSWVFFRANDFDHAVNILNAMAGLQSAGTFSLQLMSDMIGTPLLLIFASYVVWKMPNGNEIIANFEQGQLSNKKAVALTLGASVMAALSIYFIYVEGSYEFLYFQF